MKQAGLLIVPTAPPHRFISFAGAGGAVQGGAPHCRGMLPQCRDTVQWRWVEDHFDSETSVEGMVGGKKKGCRGSMASSARLDGDLRTEGS